MNGKSWHGHNLHFLWATPSIPCCSRSSGESFSPLKSALYADIQSADKTAQTNSLKASGDPTESVSSCAQPLNEVLCDSSRSGDRGTTPFAGGEHSVSEAESPGKSVSYMPLEGDESENKDSEGPEEIASDMQPDEDLKAGLSPLAGERERERERERALA